MDVVKEWMHRWVMENVYKIKIKLENIWIDLIRGIYAPYIPGTPNSASYSLRASLSSTRAVHFISKNMHGAG